MIVDLKSNICCIWITIIIGSVKSQSQSHYNPTIIQDSRLEPKADGKSMKVSSSQISTFQELSLIPFKKKCTVDHNGDLVSAKADENDIEIVSGTFGFKYKTEDGISHAAQGDPTGYIQGSYSYKDPTGLKVNFNYFAGARNNQNAVPTEQPHYKSNVPQYSPSQEPQQYYNKPDLYQQSPEYRPRTRPPTSYARPQYQPTYEPRSRFTGNNPSTFNEVYDTDDYQYRG